MSTTDVGPPRSALLAATCWVAAGVVYLTAEAVAASAFPGYSYATNYISDLGVPAVGTIDGRAIDSPLHVVMNLGFVLHGVLFAAAAVLSGPVLGAAHRRTFVGLSATHGLGIVLVGLFHSGGSHAGVGAAHATGAVMAIAGGNLAAVVGGLALRGRGRMPRLGTTCVSLGVLGLLGASALVLDGGSGPVDVLSDGTWERMSVYTVTAFELLLGSVTLARLSRRGTAPSPPRAP